MHKFFALGVRQQYPAHRKDMKKWEKADISLIAEPEAVVAGIRSVRRERICARSLDGSPGYNLNNYFVSRIATHANPSEKLEAKS